MKKDIHPQWYPQAKVTCSCGRTFTVGSTIPEIKVEICSACHPFFTGETKYVDTAGRVERFEKRREGATGKLSKKEKAKVRAAKKKEKEEADEKRPKTFKEMIQRAS